jgi:DNA-binding response OmpR family regulator
MKILIADDDRVLNHLLTSRLKVKGCEVVNAFDAMQALMSAMRSTPDVILLDIHMPGGTGIEALKKLKANSKTAMIPVIVLSGSMDPNAAAALVCDLGAADFIPKPADPEAVFTAITKALDLTPQPV